LIKRITEIGVAVKSLNDSGDRLHEILGARGGTVLKAQEYGMVAQMFRIGNIEFELMEPANQDGLIAQFLEKRGEGLHHIAFEVEDINESLNWIKRNNLRIITEQPVSIDNLKAAFLHPGSFGGVLIELIEGTPKHVDNRPLPRELQTHTQSGGVEAAGIFEVGIFVKDLESVSSIYSKIFLSKNSEIVDLEQFSLHMRGCRIENVDLKLLEINKVQSYSNALFGQNQIGLNYVTLKVRSIKKAIAYLQKKGVSFDEEPLGNFYDSPYIFIHPEELSGIPIILKE
jgi:methylmalonyl-CoA/ethylmalonyl-CoA epimerase